MEHEKLIGQVVLIRTYSAGVHYGTLIEKNGKEVILSNAIRIWYWSGAASISQLAMEGVSNPDGCKFSVPVAKILLTEAIEIIVMSSPAIINLEKVKSWKI